MLHDLRAAYRALRRAPAFVLAIVLTLGLSIGANTAIFTLVNGVLLKPLAYRDPAALQSFLEQSTQTSRLPSYLTFLDYRASANSFSGMGYVIGQSDAWRGDRGMVRFGHALVSDGFFEMLGATPALGRMLTAEDERVGAPPAAVISYAYWRSQFAGDPGVIGRDLPATSASYRIVGVLPPGAGYPPWAEVYSALAAGSAPVAMSRRDVHVDGAMLARLRPGVTVDEANRELQRLGLRFAAMYPKENAGFRGVVSPLETQIVGGGIRQPLLLLLAATLLLLVIACVNVTNLTLARLGQRTREMALRTALGAAQGRIVRQLLAESLLLAGLGAALGLMLAVWTVHLVTATDGANFVASGLSAVLPRLEEVRIDAPVFLMALGITLLAGLAAGLLPALAGSRPNLAGLLSQSGTRGGTGRAARAGRRGLIALQVGLAFALLVVAALLGNSFLHALRADRGFRSEGLLTLHVMPSPRYAAPDSPTAELYARLTERVRALPGVTSVGLVNHLPLGGAWSGTTVGIDGAPPAEGQDLSVGLRATDDAYLATMGVPLLKGRWFGAGDMTAGGNGGIVINRTMAEQYWPGQDALGHRISFTKAAAGRADFGQPLVGTVIGVVGDVKQFGLDQPSDAAIYIPYTVDPWGHSFLVVRAAVPPGTLTEPVRRALLAEEPDLVVNQISTMDDLVAGSLVSREFLLLLVGVFAAAALLLAIVGLYGVLSRLVRARERELGIRRAVGADAASIIRLVLGEGLLAVLVGITFGAGLAMAGARALQSQLFGVSAVDLPTYLVTVAVLLAVAVTACYIPARRAAAIEPTVALRGE
jgi:predicted permease